MKRKSYISIIRKRKELYGELVEHKKKRKELNKKIRETKNSLDSLDNYVLQEMK